MIRSMTGHGVGEAPIQSGHVSVEIRAINHRYLDVRVRLPAELAERASMVEERVRRSLRRGRIEVLGHSEGAAAGPPELDARRARAAFEQLRALRDELCPDEPVPMSLLASVPDLFQPPSTKPSEALERALAAAVDDACEGVWATRGSEGEALAADLEGHLDALLVEVDAIDERAGEFVASQRERLRCRLGRLLEDTEVELDPGRIEHEVALLADRADVSEELARMRSHAAQLRRLLSADEETAGKRLDFLLQEMSRETNTIGSKSADVELTRSVVEMKASISRMREQAQNVL